MTWEEGLAKRKFSGTEKGKQIKRKTDRMGYNEVNYED